jgi:hypothetical protein
MRLRLAEMLAHPVDHVELVARRIVVQPVARILGEPVFAAPGIDVAADRVAHAERPGFRIAGLGSTRRICETLVGGIPMLKGGPNGM